MSEVRIAAESRTEFGKGPARRTRRAGKVPVVLHGHGDEPRHYSMPGHELMLALKHDANQLITLETDEGEKLALAKVVVRDPIRRTLEHIDLVAIRAGEKITVEIPMTIVGKALPDTLVDQQIMTLTVEAEAMNLPDRLEVSVEGMKAGEHIFAREIPLPVGTTLIQDPESVIVQVLAIATEEELEAELDAAAAELAPDEEVSEEAAEGEAAEAAEGDAPVAEA